MSIHVNGRMLTAQGGVVQVLTVSAGDPLAAKLNDIDDVKR
jgi:hypothetical protein